LPTFANLVSNGWDAPSAPRRRLADDLISVDSDRFPGRVLYVCISRKQLCERLLVERTQGRRMLGDERSQSQSPLPLDPVAAPAGIASNIEEAAATAIVRHIGSSSHSASGGQVASAPETASSAELPPLWIINKG
jgi:hypothetical protein